MSPADLGVQPGDVIQVAIWREPEMSGEFIVDSRGRAILPLIGSVEAAGRTAGEMSDSVKAAFEIYLRNPSIDVKVLRRVSVQGQIRNPGLYPVDATIRVSDLLALAGGLTPSANANKIQLVRTGEILDVKLNSQMIIEASPVRSGDQILVAEKSWFARNSGVLAAAMITSAAIIIANVGLR